MKLNDEPICNIEWKAAKDLRANGWNPNVVFKPELALIEFSILKTGWLQPITVNRNSVVIDGFHRWSLSLNSKALQDRYRGMVPCVVLPISDPEAMLLTVRINRAKGTHAAVRMSDLVRTIIQKYGYTLDQVAQGIGAAPGEVQLLLEKDVFKAKNLDKATYSKAWTPMENHRKLSK